MRRILAALGLLSLLLAPLAAGQGHGEQVDITGASFPSALVADRTFYIDADVQNKMDKAVDVKLFAVLYNMTGGRGACDPSHVNQGISKIGKDVQLDPLQSLHIDGHAEFWRQEVDSQKLDGQGPHEVCLWSEWSCPQGGTLLQCFTDTFSLHLQVRIGNAAPAVVAQADRAKATTADVVSFTATASDADGDTLATSWDLGDGNRVDSLQVQHRYAQPGVYRAQFTASDGFDTTTRNVDIVVDPPNVPGGKGAPGLALPALLGGLALAALLRRR